MTKADPRSPKAKKPQWLKIRLPGGERYSAVVKEVRNSHLHTVCKEAHCPNQAQCWEAGTAAFMILGDTCTRGCDFCAVKRGDPQGLVDGGEPQRIQQAARAMGLDYVTVTSVTRDDLADGGSQLFADTTRALQQLNPRPKIELLIPD